VLRTGKRLLGVGRTMLRGEAQALGLTRRPLRVGRTLLSITPAPPGAGSVARGVARPLLGKTK